MSAIPVLLLLLSGCAQADRWQRSVAQFPGISQERIRNAQRIVVGSSNGFKGNYGGSRWVFEASGKCLGEISFGNNWKSRFEVKKAYDLPPEAFREIQNALLKSKVWTLKQGEQSIVFESSYGLTFECDGAKLEISWGVEWPEQCKGLWEFVGKLPERGRETSVTDTRQKLPPGGTP